MVNKANRVVARYADGRMVKGYTYDFNPGRRSFHVVSSARERASNADEVAFSHLKAVFFVDSFEGKKEHPVSKEVAADQGQIDSTIKVRATFHDGETMTGTTLAFSREQGRIFHGPVR